ncbi:hypothetical protein [Aquitalea sp. ASV15]|uniref:hypothetical protein n=1 Tax=Aquitalea sp. ASV15 TaxID=2795104 RepID=UPI0018EACD72|nr:hypothetical protein [Aquitalea sp. ASV15]
MRDLLSASEIADLRIPGLPTSKPAIIARADREQWYSETVTGRGGERRVYRLPEQYQVEPLVAAARQLSATQGAAPAVVDVAKLQMVESVLEHILQVRGLKLRPDQRGQVVAFLYDYIARGGSRETMTQALDALVA